MTISEIIKASSLGNTELAKYLRVPVRTIEDWKYGKRKPPEYIKNWVAEQIAALQKEKEDDKND